MEGIMSRVAPATFATCRTMVRTTARPSCRRLACAAGPSAQQGALGSAELSSEELQRLQAEYFGRPQVLRGIRESITPEVDRKLALVAGCVTGLGPESRVLDAGAGEGALIPHLQARGVRDILAVDVCPEALAALQERLASGADASSSSSSSSSSGYSPSLLGNDPCVRTWVGDVAALPPWQGPFDAAFFNAVWGNLHDPLRALLALALLLRPGGSLVISHPLGRSWHERYRTDNPQIVPHGLPTEEELRRQLHDLPLRLAAFQDDSSMYIARLQVPEGYAHERAPIYLSGEVTTGFGRGSRQLGVPTANLPPGPLGEQLEGLPAGVYFGWAQLDVGGDWPAADREVHPMVMNVGQRPTFEDAEPETTVELHIMHSYSSDFYGLPLKSVALGYIRPEMKFSGIQQLLGRIKTDIGIARSQLQSHQPWHQFKETL